MLNTQLAATNKANIEALMGLTAKVLEGVEQLTMLNLQTARGGLDEVKETGTALLSARDAQSLIALQTGQLQPAADKAAAYGKQVYRIVADIKADFEKVGAEQAARGASVVRRFDRCGRQECASGFERRHRLDQVGDGEREHRV